MINHLLEVMIVPRFKTESFLSVLAIITKPSCHAFIARGIVAAFQMGNILKTGLMALRMYGQMYFILNTRKLYF